MLFAAHLQTLEPPQPFASVRRNSFLEAVYAYLHQVSASEGADVTDAAANLLDSVYKWSPPLGLGLLTEVAVVAPSSASHMGLNVYRPSLNTLRSGVTDSVRISSSFPADIVPDLGFTLRDLVVCDRNFN